MFQPIGLKSAVKLQDLFTNAKIPRERRRDLIVAAAAGGEIFWVEGLRISENFKLTPETKRRLDVAVAAHCKVFEMEATKELFARIWQPK